MTRFFPLLFLLFTAVSPASALANAESDSLRQAIRSMPEDTLRIRKMNRVGFLEKASATEAAVAYLRKSIALAQQLNFPNGEAQARMYIGQAYTVTGDYATALDELAQAVGLYTDSRDINGAGKAWNSIGVIRFYQADYTAAAEAYTNALERFSNPFYIATTYNNIANSLKLAGDSEGFVSHQLKALEKFRELEQVDMQLYCLNNLAIFYHAQDDLSTARRYNQEGYELLGDSENKEQRISLDLAQGEIEQKSGNIALALELFRGVRTLAKEEGFLREEATAWGNLAKCYAEQGKYEMSYERAHTALAIFQKLQDKRGQAKTLLIVAQAQLELENTDSALKNQHEALALAIEVEEPALLAMVYDQLSSGYEAAGDASNALHYRTRYSEVKEELMDPKKWRAMLEMETGYHRERQEKAIADLTRDRDAAAEQNKYLVGGLLGVLLLSLVGLGYGFWRYRRQYAKLERREKDKATLEHLDLLLENAEAKGRVQQLKEQLLQKEKLLQSLRRNPLAQTPRQTLLPPNFEMLSAREVEVFLCLGEGLSDKDIAEELSISVATVRTHARKVYGKLDLSNRAGAVKLTHEYRLLREKP